MAGDEKKQKSGAAQRNPPFRITVSDELREYLRWLSRNTLLGKKDTDVASFLLTQRLQQMRRRHYTEETPPEKKRD